MLTKREELEQLNKERLIDDYLLLEKRLETLERQMGELKRALGIKPVKTSKNSSVPPSQEQKVNRNGQKKAKRGAKKGHRGTSRPRREPDEIIECRVSQCQACGTDLSDLLQHVAARHQVLDIPPLQAIVREVVRYGRYCPCCQKYQRAEAPQGFERGRVVGQNLEHLVLYLHYAHPLSYERVARILSEVYGLQLGQGSLVNIVKRARNRLKQAADLVHEQIKQAPVVGSDETGARVDGRTYWQWVFQTPKLAYYVIQPSRSAQVIADVMDDAQTEVWISDVFSSQMCHSAQEYQICLAHQLRDLQYLIDSHQCQWADQMQTLLRRAIHLHKLRDKLSKKRFELFAQAYNWRLGKLLAQSPPSEDSQRLWRRFHKHREALLLFLKRSDVAPTNNASEQALRNSVIYRKVTGVSLGLGR
ncbi:MAG: IS66 family transposase [Anaerolineae bacterium]|nr:IS66 family transposase [Anaerolineae bacterium]